MFLHDIDVVNRNVIHYYTLLRRTEDNNTTNNYE